MLMRDATRPSAAKATQGMKIETGMENDLSRTTGVAPAIHAARLSSGAAGPKRRKCQRPTARCLPASLRSEFTICAITHHANIPGTIRRAAPLMR
jgi:hypothetical protein